MEAKPSRLKRWSVSAALLFLYVQCRAIYFPVFWLGFPGYTDWATFKSEKPAVKKGDPPVEHFYFVDRDLPRLATVYLYAGAVWFMSWVSEWSYFWSFCLVALVCAFVFAYNWLIMRRQVKKFTRLRDLEEATEAARNLNPDSHVGN